jgi:hypothetical protein
MRLWMRPRRWGAALSAALVLAAAGNAAAAPTAAAAKSAAEMLVARTLRDLPRYPGAWRASLRGFPMPRAPETWPSPELVTASTLWYVPTSSDSFTAWVAETLAAQGLHPAGSATDSGPSGTVIRVLLFTPMPDRDQLEVEVSWQVTDKAPTAVRYDVQAIWQPPRPAAAVLPSGLRSATVSLFDRAHPKGLVATVRGEPLAYLATLYAGLPMDTRGPHSCPAVILDMGNTVASVRFLGATRSLAVEEGRVTCGDAVVDGGDGSTVADLFDPNEALLQAVEGILARQPD